MSKFSILFIIASIFLLNSCKKEPSIKSWFDNQCNEPVIVTLYYSKSDMLAGNDGVFSVTIPANTTATVPEDALDESRGYWIDWHSISYTYGNWPDLLYCSTSVGMALSGNWTNFARKVFINKENVHTVWKAISKGSNVPLAPGEHYEIEITRDGKYIFNENGIISQDMVGAGDVYDPNSGTHYLELWLRNYRFPGFAANLTQGTYPWGTYDTPALGSDTAILLRDQTDPSLRMVRQQ